MATPVPAPVGDARAPSRLSAGIGLMLTASTSFALMGAFVKVAGRELSPLALVFGRSLVVVLLTLGWTRGRRERYRVHRPGLLLWRSLTGFTSMLLYFAALAALPLSTAVTIQYLSPVFVSLLSARVLREPVSRGTLGLVLVAFAGAALVLSPELSSPRIEIAFAVVSALLAALAYLAVRRLSYSDTAETVVLYFGLFSTLATAPWAPALLGARPIELLAVAGVGTFSFFGQLCMTHAYRHAEAAVVSAFSYFTVIVAAILGVLCFGETLPRASGLGVALLVGAGVTLSMLRWRAAGRRRPPA